MLAQGRILNPLLCKILRELGIRYSQFNTAVGMSSSGEGINLPKEKSNLLQAEFVGKDAPTLPTRSVIREAAPQFFASLGFGFMVATVAAICMIPTIVIDALRHPDSEIPLDKTQQSWYGSLSFLVQPIGSITSGFTQNMFGRRRMMLVSTVPLFASWIFLHFASDVATLYTTQIVFGLSIGFMEAPSMSFLGEAMQPKYRGTLTALSEFLYILGSLYLFTCGVYFDWRTVALCGAVPALVTFCILCALPESPTWFIVKGRLEEAADAMMWLRGWVTREEVEQEVRMLTKTITENPFSGAKIIDGEYTRVPNTPSQVVLFKESRVWKPVLLIFIFFFAGNAGSLIGMRPFFSKMFEDLNMPIAPGLVLVMSSALNAVGCIACTCLVHKTGKRWISIGSLLMLAACCFLLAAYTASGVTLPWLATLLFAVNFFTAGFGILTMPWALVSECFALEARGLSAGICAASAYVSYFIFSKTYYTLEDWITMPGVFAMYGLISVLGASYLNRFMPETEGKTLEEIEEFFQK